MNPENERRNMDQFILEALARLENKVGDLSKEVSTLKVELASKPVPARPCEYFREHLEDHKRESEASRAFWYQRLGAVLDALWKPVLALLLLGAVLSGQIKIDLLRGADAPSTPKTKEVFK